MGNDLFRKGYMDNKLGEISHSAEIGGKKFVIETGKLGKLASGSAIVTVGETVVMANVVVCDHLDETKDYFPLTVDFEEKWYATGKISGSRFIKREARPSDLAVLRSRMIDRPIRPMFPKGYMNEMQLIVTPLSMDLEIDPVVPGINAASCALMISGAPFEGPIGAVRMAKVDGKVIANPTYEEMESSEADILVVGTEDAITMIEAEAKEIPESEFSAMLEEAHKHIKEVIALQKKLIADKKEVKKQEYKLVLPDEKVLGEVKKYLVDKMGDAIRHEDKMVRNDLIESLEDEVSEKFADDFEEVDIKAAFDKAVKDEVRRSIIEEGVRPDHRKMSEIRPLSAEVSFLPRTHGSAIFNRGITQVLSITTLGSPGKAQVIDTMDQDTEKFFIHHYNDSPFAYGDVGRLGPGRRAVGHGFLAEKALTPVIPEHTDYPYTIRVVSEVMSCNGSSSMASVCGASLSLADAGVPIKKHVAGIAMGLVTENGSLDGKYEILTDIQAAEDFAGDMDFKAAGTHDGLTAFQLDIKIKGLKIDFIKTVLDQAKVAREEILSVMEKTIPEPRKEMSKYAPRLTTLHINPEKIRTVIGKGGEMINKIIAETGTEIDIEDDGTIVISSVNGDDSQAAVDWIKGLTDDPEVGKTYDGKVVKIMDFGAFVEFMPGQEGLVHISQIADDRVEKVTDVLKEGQEVKVKLLEIDSQGRKNLSIKAAK
jgi:polyribonucleotide nucleotidyltransferase